MNKEKIEIISISLSTGTLQKLQKVTEELSYRGNRSEAISKIIDKAYEELNKK